MPTLAHETGNPAQTDLVWPNHAPSVAVDTVLGKQYQNFDVDPYKLTALLQELGADESQIPGVTYHFKAKLPSGEGGSYHPEEKEVHLPGYDPAVAVTIHESKHAADDTQGLLRSGKEILRQRRLAAIAGGIGGAALGSLIDPELGGVIAAYGLLPMGGVTAALMATLRLSRDERPAYRLMKDKDLLQNYQNTVSTTKRKRR